MPEERVPPLRSFALGADATGALVAKALLLVLLSGIGVTHTARSIHSRVSAARG